jgi:hypothetical protein
MTQAPALLLLPCPGDAIEHLLNPHVSARSGHLSNFPSPGPREPKGLGDSYIWGLLGLEGKGRLGAPSCSPKA